MIFISLHNVQTSTYPSLKWTHRITCISMRPYHELYTRGWKNDLPPADLSQSPVSMHRTCGLSGIIYRCKQIIMHDQFDRGISDVSALWNFWFMDIYASLSENRNSSLILEIPVSTLEENFASWIGLDPGIYYRSRPRQLRYQHQPGDCWQQTDLILSLIHGQKLLHQRNFLHRPRVCWKLGQIKYVSFVSGI